MFISLGYNEEKEKESIMKKGLQLLLVLICLFTLVGCGSEKFTADEIKFREEYSSLNGKKTESGKTYLPIFIEEKTGVEYKTAKEIVNIMKKGTGVIYLGFPECPWCRNALPVLLEAMDEEEYRTLYYLNAKDIRDEKHLDEAGNIVTDKEGTEEYKEMLEILKDYLDPYTGLEDNTVKRIYLPTVIFVKDGKIKGVHTGTIDSQSDPYQGLSEAEEDKLEEIYENYVKEVKGTVCAKNGC